LGTGLITYCSNERRADEIVDYLPLEAGFNPLLQPVVESDGSATQYHILTRVGIVVVFPKPSNSEAICFNVVEDGESCSATTPSGGMVGFAGVERWINKAFAWASIFNLEVVFAAKG
jgi:hypothetical protein